ncbi:MAG: AAA family ATPase [Eubacteriales bacterium]|nr:AAA family ATPase [Eubacteriales bacterium]
MNNEGIQIRFSDLLRAILKHSFMITAFTAAGLLVGVALSGVSYLRGSMSREYVISEAIAVNAQVGTDFYASNSAHLTDNDFYLAEQMATATIYVLQGDKFISTALSNAGLVGVQLKDVTENITFKQYEDTQIIDVVLYWRSAEEGTAVINAINDYASDFLKETLHVGGINVVNGPDSRYLFGGSLNAALCGLLTLIGFGIGLGIAILEMVVRPTLLNTSDMEANFGIEVLGEIPSKDSYFKKNGSILIRNNTFADITDSFSSLAHIIQNRVSSGDECKVIYVTSATRNEGKTMTVANLGIQMSDLEKKVLLIDLDLKNPHLGSMFLSRIDYDHSINALYRGDINEIEAITTLTGFLDILPAVSERSSIPFDKTVFNLIEKLESKYDYILIDTAPVGVSASTLSLNGVADASILVVRQDTASMQEIKETLDRMDKSGIQVLGCVVNDVKMRDNNIFGRDTGNKRIKNDKSTAENFAAEDEESAEQRYAIRQSFDDIDKSDEVKVATSDDFADALFKMYGGKDEAERISNNAAGAVDDLSSAQTEEDYAAALDRLLGTSTSMDMDSADSRRADGGYEAAKRGGNNGRKSSSVFFKGAKH